MVHTVAFFVKLVTSEVTVFVYKYTVYNLHTVQYSTVLDVRYILSAEIWNEVR